MRSHRETLGVLSGAFLAITLGALDQAIVTPALPAIARDLHGLEGLSWIVVAYLVTSTTMTLIYGKPSDAYGRGRFVTVRCSSSSPPPSCARSRIRWRS